MKIELKTHRDDLDGIGCAILAKLAFGEDVHIDYCSCNKTGENYIDDAVSKFINENEYQKYDLILITDLSVSEENAMKIQHIDNPLKFQLLDHHPTALNLNQFPWSNVSVTDLLGEKTSGTRLLYDYLIEKKYLKYQENIFDFVENVRKYDTWLWKEKYNDDNPKKWSDLMRIIGRKKFQDMLVSRLSTPEWSLSFTKMDQTILEIEQERIDQYIHHKQKYIIEKEILGYKAGIVFAETYQSETGNVLAENNPHLDFIVMINPSFSVSYRGVKDIDLGKNVAKIFNGGGHPKTAGSPLPENFANKVIDMIFNLQ
jgi:oligoribonuclease NrnB/cAMP/cGMP phosphodiesterase (DHH superfamily)